MSEEKMLINNVLVPKLIGLLEESGRTDIELGEMKVELAQILRTVPIEEAKECLQDLIQNRDVLLRGGPG